MWCSSFCPNTHNVRIGMKAKLRVGTRVIFKVANVLVTSINRTWRHFSCFCTLTNNLPVCHLSVYTSHASYQFSIFIDKWHFLNVKVCCDTEFNSCRHPQTKPARWNCTRSSGYLKKKWQVLAGVPICWHDGVMLPSGSWGLKCWWDSATTCQEHWLLLIATLLCGQEWYRKLDRSQMESGQIQGRLQNPGGARERYWCPSFVYQLEERAPSWKHKTSSSGSTDLLSWEPALWKGTCGGQQAQHEWKGHCCGKKS